jgi:HTH-type transcriptional regulator / antitoxin HigA
MRLTRSANRRPTLRERDHYLELVKAFPLRPLRSDDEHEQAVRVLSRLVGRPRPRLSGGERDYADALSRFIRDYDEREYPMLPKQRSPLERLRYLMHENDMTAADLESVLEASQPLVSQLLRGKRNLTPNHMRRLASRFRVEAGYFI